MSNGAQNAPSRFDRLASSSVYILPMPPLSIDVVRKLRVPGYLVMGMLTSLPIIELAASSWPLQLHLAAWRLNVVGAAGATGVTALLGLYFIFAIATASDDRGVLLVVSSICAVAAVLCLAAAGLFPLDALQMKGQVRPDALTRFGAASIVAMLKICFAGVVSVALAISSFRAASRGRAEKLRERGAGSLVVGQPAARAGNS